MQQRVKTAARAAGAVTERSPTRRTDPVVRSTTSVAEVRADGSKGQPPDPTLAKATPAAEVGEYALRRDERGGVSMHDDHERVDITPPRRATRMTGLWVFLGGVAVWLIMPLFRPRPGVLECSDGPSGGECVERYIEPAIVPPVFGFVLLGLAVGLAVLFFARARRLGSSER